MNILFFPVFTDSQAMTDHYYRLHWYLYPFREQIEQITMLQNFDGDFNNFPNYLDPALLELVGKLPSLNIVKKPVEADLSTLIEKSDVVLYWEIDPAQRDKIPPSKF